MAVVQGFRFDLAPLYGGRKDTELCHLCYKQGFSDLPLSTIFLAFFKKRFDSHCVLQTYTERHSLDLIYKKYQNALEKMV